MEWFRWERNPWGQEILIGLSWDLIWVAVAAGALLIVAHALLYSWRWRGADAGTISETLLLSSSLKKFSATPSHRGSFTG